MIRPRQGAVANADERFERVEQDSRGEDVPRVEAHKASSFSCIHCIEAGCGDVNALRATAFPVRAAAQDRKPC